MIWKWLEVDSRVVVRLFLIFLSSSSPEKKTFRSDPSLVCSVPSSSSGSRWHNPCVPGRVGGPSRLHPRVPLVSRGGFQGRTTPWSRDGRRTRTGLRLLRGPILGGKGMTCVTTCLDVFGSEVLVGSLMWIGIGELPSGEGFKILS